MQPLPPAGGAPFFTGPTRAGSGTPPPSKNPDRVEFAGKTQESLILPKFAKAEAQPDRSPRPWPPGPGDLPRSSALAALNSRSQIPLTSAALFAGPMGAALLANLNGPPAQSEQAAATPSGWKVQKNPSRHPVSPRDPFEITPSGDELGPLRIVASSTGRIRSLRLQWPEEFQEPAYSAQRSVFFDLTTRLSGDVVFHVVAEGLAAQALPGILKEWSFPEPGRVHIHSLHLRSTPDMLYEPMTMWARDGALLLRAPDHRSILMLPRSFRGDGQVDAKLNRLVIQGTGAAPARLQSALPELMVRRSHLSFEGGDVIASRKAVLLGAQTIAGNVSQLKLPPKAVVEEFEKLLGLPVIVIDPQPEFHLDLGFTFLDDTTIAVADPSLAIQLVGKVPELQPLLQATKEKQLVEKYDRAAVKLAQLGYCIVRLPTLAGLGLTTPYLTYNNVLLENYLQNDQPVKKVYMPTYGVDLLDEAARITFRAQGFQVIDMPSARLSTKLWGAIRCATGELEISDC